MSLPVHHVTGLAGVGDGDEVHLTGPEAHHAVAVRRLRPGEQLLLTDGAGTAVTGEVATTGKRELTVLAREVTAYPRPEPRVTVVQALPKQGRGELAVEAATEIGADRVVPWAAARCVTVWREDRAAKSLAKWRSTAAEAAKQARRVWFPEVTEQAGTDGVAALVAEADLAVVLHEDATTPLAGLAVPGTGSLVVVVGPEGGITEEERGTLAAAGAVEVALGAEVLRTSTAGLAAVAALLARTPRWGAGATAR